MKPLANASRLRRVPEEGPPEIDELISRCLEVDQRKRPSAKEVFCTIHALGAPAAPRATCGSGGR